MKRMLRWGAWMEPSFFFSDWKKEWTLTIHQDIISAVTFHPSGRFLASGSFDSTLKILSLEGIVLQILWDHGDVINTILFSSDGLKMYSASLDRSVCIYHVYHLLIKQLLSMVSDRPFSTALFSIFSKCQRFYL